MKFLVVGAGAQGGPCVSILSKDPSVKEIILGDIDIDLANKVKAKLWDPQSWDPRWAWKILKIIREVVGKHRLTIAKAFITGSMAYDGKGHDIDVLIIIKEKVEPKILEEIEVEIKAEWDAWACDRNLPPLDPIVLAGYMPFNGVIKHEG